MCKHCPYSVHCEIARFCFDLDQGLISRCLCKSEEFSVDQALIGLITANYSVQALKREGPSSTITFILHVSVERQKLLLTVLIMGFFKTFNVDSFYFCIFLRSFHFQFNKFDT